MERLTPYSPIDLHEVKDRFHAIEWDRNDKILCCCTTYCGICSFCSFIFAFIACFLIGWGVASVITANAIVDSEVRKQKYSSFQELKLIFIV